MITCYTNVYSYDISATTFHPRIYNRTTICLLSVKSAADKTHFNILPFGLNSEFVTINYSDFEGSYIF